MKTKFDVIVIGAGHAGCEAALASARIGVETLLITQNIESIALTPCNPSIGGPGKSHLVAEIDALGGEMARNTEKSYIQVRTLNLSKGKAVQAWRAQIDKSLYQKNMRKTLESQDNLFLKQAEVTELILQNNKIIGIKTSTSISYHAKSVIICSGTYLRSYLVVGRKRFKGGPHGQPPSFMLGEFLEDNGFSLRRLQTATPARVIKNSLDFDKFSPLYGEIPHPDISSFLRLHDRIQIPSHLAFTNKDTIRVISENLENSPLIIGNIVDTGPRHCPSIDRKIIKFPEKSTHQVFIEPQGYENNEMYIQGATSAMPPEIQLMILKTIPGFENVIVSRYGYGIEYDALEPSELSLSLESKRIKGLFFAGQINGTSGYEEAAAQGLIAGINAAHNALSKDPLILSRDNSYIGVLIDDLITKQLNEPYRMYTSRAEFRLLLRIDNATKRLSKTGWSIGLLSDSDYKSIRAFWLNLAIKKRMIKKIFVYPDANTNRILSEYGLSPIKKKQSLFDFIARNDIVFTIIKKLGIEIELNKNEFEYLKEDSIYTGYWIRFRNELEKFKKLERIKIKENFDPKQIPGLRNEAIQRLKEIRPVNLGQITRLQGITPSDISIIMRYINNTV